ncbi:MAG: 50S ribosomal protein L23 [Chlamydiae bacterium]|nr:50S ribosomal protein L23 [Chlamydiota bacterium]
MKRINPRQIIKNRHVTEKTTTLEGLKSNDSNPCISRFDQPKYVFIVDRRANKKEIAQALEEIYKEQNIKVTSVNTINVKPKSTRMLRTRRGVGRKSGFKKAVVTLEAKDSLDNV